MQKALATPLCKLTFLIKITKKSQIIAIFLILETQNSIPWYKDRLQNLQKIPHIFPDLLYQTLALLSTSAYSPYQQTHTICRNSYYQTLAPIAASTYMQSLQENTEREFKECSI